MKAPSRKTVLRLYTMSGNACAFSTCKTPIFSEGANLGEVCHIRAHRDGGKRYDAGQNDVERPSFDTLILLCCNHHKKIDDLDQIYTVARKSVVKGKSVSVGVDRGGRGIIKKKKNPKEDEHIK